MNPPSEHMAERVLSEFHDTLAPLLAAALTELTTT